MPSVNLFLWCTDVLASRYGWTRKYIETEFYWEEFWKMVKVAANFTADERNANMKFHFMLHADKKSARKWKELPIPFPTEDDKKESGISQLPSHLTNVVYRED